MEYYNSEIVKMDETNGKIVLDQSTDRSYIGISASRKAPNAKHCNTSSGGHFFMNINCHNIFLLAVVLTTLNLAQSAPLPPPIILVFSITNTNNPLHMVVGDSPHVTTSISQSQGYFDNNALLINLNFNGQGLLYLTERNNTYYVAINSNNTVLSNNTIDSNDTVDSNKTVDSIKTVDSNNTIDSNTTIDTNTTIDSNNTIDYNNTIVPLLEDEIDNADKYTFREEATDDAEQVRYYLQIGGEKYYLMAASDGKLVALHADDLVLESENDTRSRFISIYF